MENAILRRRLLGWYRKEARDLPWRRRKDPYAIWVSEVMLQQTRVDVATPYFLRWMARFPTVQALAAADPEDVLRLWSGLGYYTRARSLHAAAREVAANGFPADAAGWRELSGIGPYTAGAIASIASGERVPAVDGNVVRVLARLHGWRGSASSPGLREQVDAAAARLVPAKAPGDWNQALMDLGATVCTPREPDCGACPVAELCVARAKGLQAAVPTPKERRAARVERRAFAVVERKGEVLFVRGPDRGLLAGLWSLPGGDAAVPLADQVRSQSGVTVRLHGKAARARHQFSHRTWEMTVRRAEVVREAPLADGVRWLPVDRLADEAVPAAVHAALQAVGVARPKSSPASARP